MLLAGRSVFNFNSLEHNSRRLLFRILAGARGAKPYDPTGLVATLVSFPHLVDALTALAAELRDSRKLDEASADLVRLVAGTLSTAAELKARYLDAHLELYGVGTPGENCFLVSARPVVGARYEEERAPLQVEDYEWLSTWLSERASNVIDVSLWIAAALGDEASKRPTMGAPRQKPKPWDLPKVPSVQRIRPLQSNPPPSSDG